MSEFSPERKISEADIIQLGNDIETFNTLGRANPAITIEQFAIPTEQQRIAPQGPITMAEIALQKIELDSQEARENQREFTPPTEDEVAYLEKLLKKTDEDTK